MFQFEELAYQKAAVASVVNAFANPSKASPEPSVPVSLVKSRKGVQNFAFMDDKIYANVTCVSSEQILSNIQAIQKDRNLPRSVVLRKDPDLKCGICLDVEMETGTGKTYVYLRTMLELHEKYGWDRFILTVPTIAIRQGVMAALKGMEEHFASLGRIRLFQYDSRNAETLAKDYCAKCAEGEIHLLLLNTQKFNKEGNIIHTAREQLGEASVAECVSKTNPVIFIDEPQKQGGEKTLEGLSKFCPFAVIHYSATHKLHHELVYRLSGADALNQNLVKHILVDEATTTEQGFRGAYIVNRSRKIEGKYVLRLGVLKRRGNGALTTQTITPHPGENLADYVSDVPGYENYVVQGLDTRSGRVSFSAAMTGASLAATELEIGEGIGGAFENELREAQIRVAVKAHLATEEKMFSKGIKSLTLFFIDRVEKYDGANHARDGEYASILQRVYKKEVARVLSRLNYNDSEKEYAAYLEKTVADEDALRHIHGGYFSSDRASADGKESEEAKDYEAILNDKEALLRINRESVTGTDSIRFIFSHSALREGWDNPNVFTICFLKEAGKNEGTLRQEIGRGLRICVDQSGTRRHDASLNELTAITTRDFADVVRELQADVEDTKAAIEKIIEETVVDSNGTRVKDVVKNAKKTIVKYLDENGYVKDNRLQGYFKDDYLSGNLPLTGFREPLESLKEIIFAELAKVRVSSESTPGVKQKKDKKEVKRRTDLDKDVERIFKAVAKKISAVVAYELKYDDDKLVQMAFDAIRKNTRLPSRDVNVLIRQARQKDENEFTAPEMKYTLTIRRTSHDATNKYNLVGDVMAKTGLSQATTRELLKKIWAVGELKEHIRNDYDAFTQGVADAVHEAWFELMCNPENISYVRTPDPDNLAAARYEMVWSPKEDHATDTILSGDLKKHVYSALAVDSAAKDLATSNEGSFALEMENCESVMFYAKLPDGFKLPTPLGAYNPDWVVILNPKAHPNKMYRVYYVCETKRFKGNDRWQTTAELSPVEKGKLKCAEILFKAFDHNDPDVHYTVLNGNYCDPNGAALGAVQQLLRKSEKEKEPEV